jgi:hypothetical protein
VNIIIFIQINVKILKGVFMYVKIIQGDDEKKFWMPVNYDLHLTNMQYDKKPLVTVTFSTKEDCLILILHARERKFNLTESKNYLFSNN